NKPSSAYAFATGAVGDEAPTPFANFGGGAALPANPIALQLADTPSYFIADPPVIPWALYAITGNWNATGAPTTVYVP
nr:hypothetical protein [Tanacetum cinerariifolium]